MPTAVSYPSGRAVNFNIGVGMHDLSLLASGNGWSASSITAHAGGTRAAATPITSAITLIAVCATINDSVVLPPAMGGQVLWISNAGVAAAQIFAANGTSDTINGVAAATGIGLAQAERTRWGGTVGVGVEFGFAPNWTAGLEYDYMWRVSDSSTFLTTGLAGVTSITANTGTDISLLTARVSYKFGGTPVVAKY